MPPERHLYLGPWSRGAGGSVTGVSRGHLLRDLPGQDSRSGRDVSDEDRALAFANIEKAMIWPKPRGSSDAPPTSAPSMSGFCNNALALSGFTLPPYWIRTSAETVWSEIEAITDRCWLVAAAMVMTAFAYCCAFTAVEVNISED